MIDFLKAYARGQGVAPPPAPLIDYDFTGGALPSGVSFSRASSGTRFNASGVMVTEAAGAPRFDYDPVTLASRGLLIEPQATNSVYTAIPNSSWTGQGYPYGQHFTIAANATTSPTGGTNANTLLDTTTTFVHQCSPGTSASVTSGLTYVLSVFAKQKDQYALDMRGSWGSLFSSRYAVFDLRDGSSPTKGTVTSYATPIGNGWYRCVMIATATGTGSGPQLAIALRNNDLTNTSVPSYTGTGASGLYVYGANVVQAAKESSYIHSTSGAVTRAAEVVSFAVPSGVTTLRFTFDNDNTQDVDVSAYAGGTYVVPTNFNRAWVKRVRSV